jgi:hypothetical protein
VGTPMELDHLIPTARGGPTDESNLWLACSVCNEHKGQRMIVEDPETGDSAPIFDPRHQVWSEHFSMDARRHARSRSDGYRPRHCRSARPEPAWPCARSGALGFGRLAPTQGLTGATAATCRTLLSGRQAVVHGHQRARAERGRQRGSSCPRFRSQGQGPGRSGSGYRARAGGPCRSPVSIRWR